MRAHKQQTGFTLIEMIVVMVITGIIGGMVAMFIRAPVQGYADSSRRAEMGDIADTALRRLARDIRTAVPNSIRVPSADCIATTATSCYAEYLPTRDGGRYRAGVNAGGGGNVLVFGPGGTQSFDILGTSINFIAGDQIVIGSTQSDGNLPYNNGVNGILRAHNNTQLGLQTTVNFGAFVYPDWAQVTGQRFDVVPGDQQAVTYACEGVNIVGGEGTGTLRRYWHYGFNVGQLAPPLAGAGSGNALLADRLGGCEISYAPINQRNGLLTIWLQITRGGESIRLNHAIHINNVP